MDTPLPPASTWSQYPEVAIIILVALVLTAAFVIYSERREKAWQRFLVEQRVAGESAQKDAQTQQTQAYEKMLKSQQDFWKEQRDGDRRVMDELVKEIKSFRIDHQVHDQNMIQAITKMEERTRTTRKRMAP